MKPLVCALLLALAAPAWCAGIERIDPPEQGFYAKRLVYGGIAVKSHASVDDRALLLARDKVARMLRFTPKVRANLAAAGAELHVIAASQATSDLPENRHFKGRLFEGTLTLDERTRGIGGLLASCGEENLLALPGDRYAGRDICTHEFAHAIHAVGMDATTRTRFADRYAAAKAQALWRGFFAEKNADEFFAELTMAYFGSDGEPDHLARRDPQTYALLDRFYRGRLGVTAGLWRPAPDEAQARSAPTESPARLVIRNLTATVVQLYWLDFDGARRFYAAIPPYGFALQDTYVRHAWAVTGEDGRARALTVAVQPGSVLTVR